MDAGAAAQDAPRERRSLSSTLVLTTLANLAVPLTAALTGPLLARVLGVEGRGQLAAVLAPLTLAMLLFNGGLPEAVTYHVARRKGEHARIVWTGAAMAVLTGIAAAGTVIAVAPILLEEFSDGVLLLSILAAVTLPAQAVMQSLRGVAQGLGRFELTIRERWANLISRLILLFAVAAIGELTVTSAAVITEGTAVAAAVLLFPVVKGLHGRGVDRAVARSLTGFAGRNVTGTLSGIVILRIDQVLLAPLVGPVQLGYYAVAVTLAEIPAYAQKAFREVIFASSARRSDPYLVARAARVIVLVQVPLCAAGILLAPHVIHALFGEDFKPATDMARVLFVATIPAGCGVVLGAGLLAVGRPELRSLALVTGAASTVVALFVLVPRFDALGAAYASLISYVLSAGLLVILFHRETGLPVRDCLIPTVEDARMVRHRGLAMARAALRRGRR